MIGTVLWFNERDGNGVIIDKELNEYYTDTSVIENNDNLERGDMVSFEINENIKDCLCAKNVKVLK